MSEDKDPENVRVETNILKSLPEVLCSGLIKKIASAKLAILTKKKFQFSALSNNEYLVKIHYLSSNQVLITKLFNF